MGSLLLVLSRLRQRGLVNEVPRLLSPVNAPHAGPCLLIGARIQCEVMAHKVGRELGQRVFQVASAPNFFRYADQG